MPPRVADPSAPHAVACGIWLRFSLSRQVVLVHLQRQRSSWLCIRYTRRSYHVHLHLASIHLRPGQEGRPWFVACGRSLPGVPWSLPGRRGPSPGRYVCGG